MQGHLENDYWNGDDGGVVVVNVDVSAFWLVVGLAYDYNAPPSKPAVEAAAVIFRAAPAAV